MKKGEGGGGDKKKVPADAVPAANPFEGRGVQGAPLGEIWYASKGAFEVDTGLA